MPEPRHNKGYSSQVYCTPDNFLDAVRIKLCIRDFVVDLAASEENAICPLFITEADNSLIQPWHILCGKKNNGIGWCNPPFADIEPWVHHAYEEGQWQLGAESALLLPAGVGANWWRDFVHQKAAVLFLNGRIKFVGAKDVYPKDCVLLRYGPSVQWGYDIWSWSRELL